MTSSAKNKLLTWLVALLLIANTATLAMFWLDRGKTKPPPHRSPQLFLIESLNLDAKQQLALKSLVASHREITQFLRMQLKKSKEDFFNLVKQPNLTDSMKIKDSVKKYSGPIAFITAKLDNITLEHFRKVRALCRPDQQKKFDEIILEVTSMMGQPRPPMGSDKDGQGPPPGDPGGDRPPPPEQ